MDLSFSYFWEQMIGNPLLLMAVTLTLGVILVNGWTDAPNAIATCVVTRCMPPKRWATTKHPQADWATSQA